MSRKNDPEFHLPTFCCYCGKQIRDIADLTAEHLVPVSKGGNNSLYNKRACCVKCNSERGNKRLDVFLIILQQDYEVERDPVSKYRLEAMILNVEHMLEYVRSAGDKLYRIGAKRPL